MTNPANIFWIIAVWYILFFLENVIPWKKEIISMPAQKESFHGFTAINLKNLFGIIMMCLPLILFYGHWRWLIEWPAFNSFVQAALMILLFALTVVITLQQAIQKSKNKNFNKTKSISKILSYISIRTIFLIVYECFFRGLLLMVFISAFGVSIAIAVNIFLYVCVHAHSERIEILACIPFGLTLCGITIYYRSIFPAIILHLVLALVYEIYLLLSPIPKNTIATT